MAELRVTVVTYDIATADALVGVVPADADVTLVVLGTDADTLSSSVKTLPVARAVAVPGVGRASETDVVGPLLRELVEGRLIVLDSDQSSRDLAGWLCATLDVPVVWAIDALRTGDDGALEADRVVLGGGYRMVHRVAVQPGAIVLAKSASTASSQGRIADQAPEVTTLAGDVPAGRLRFLTEAESTGGGVPLAAARTVISVGRGIGGAERLPTFRELADRVHAALGASRVAVDSGWIPFAHQVGQTGTAVAPDLYVAFGISGAIQHLAGMRTSKRVVAVNTDPEAPICQLADLVINADACQVAEAVLQQVAANGSA